MTTQEPAGGPERDDADGPPSLPDEVWERFIADSEQAIRDSAPKEPSARARMVTARLRELDEAAARQAGGPARRRFGRGAGKAGRGPAGGSWQPEGWRTGPVRQEANGRAGRRRRGAGVLGVLAAVSVAVVAVSPGWALSHLPGGLGDRFTDRDARGAAGTAPSLPPETARPTAPPAAGFPGVPTLDRPFAGSPAERYADGAEGITLPEATAVGSLSKDRVAFALRQARRLLVDANLDPVTLRGGHPDESFEVLEPRQEDVAGLLRTALREPDEDHDPLWMFSRFDPDEVRLVGDVVKTRGRMTFEAGRRASVVVHADYTFVYPLAKAGPGATEVTRTIVRRVLDLELSDPSAYRVTPGRLVVTRFDQSTGNSACGVHDGYLHPRFAGDAPAGPTPTGPATDPYDRSQDLDPDRPVECGTATRT
ncbi:hypothetical protein [Streptomyces glaucus]|uniref:Uncharacterized protein n=1 Tax=Streptomyces glaucus TaxID=284029 RepID=A0ABP5XR25_9ACTN